MEFQPTDDWDEWEMSEEMRLASEVGIGGWEFAIMKPIWHDYGQVKTREELIRRAFGTRFDRNPARALSAIEKGFPSGWIQFLTADFLNRMQREFADGGYITANGLIGVDYPPIPKGDISFTELGASLYLRYVCGVESNHPLEWHWCLTKDHDGSNVVYGTSVDECEHILETNPPEVIEQEPPIEVGRWCDRWWLRFEHGYKIRFRTTEDEQQSHD